MKKPVLIVISALVLGGCTNLSEKDQSLLNYTREIAVTSGENSAQALEEARQAKAIAQQAAQEAVMARQEAIRAARAATAAADKADRIFMAESGFK